MLIRDSAAWFNTETGTPLGQNIHIEKMAFTFTGSLGSVYRTNSSDETTEFVITDVNLLRGDGKITCANNSTIDTEMRFQIQYGPLNGASGTPVTFQPSAANTTVNNGVKTMKDDALEIRCPDTWDYRDGYVYYSASGSNVIPKKVSANAAAQTYDILTYLAFSEEGLSKTYSSLGGTSCAVTVTVQARQSDIMIWQDVATISTGA